MPETWTAALVAFVLEKSALLALMAAIWFLFPILEIGVRRFIRSHLTRLKEQANLEYLVATTLRYIKYFLIILVVLEIIGLGGVATAALTSVGFVGLVLGLAAQTVAANMVAGVFVLLDAEIAINDRVKVGDVEGVIRKIKLRSTLVELDDGTLAVVPNKKLIDEVVLNRRGHKKA